MLLALLLSLASPTLAEEPAQPTTTQQQQARSVSINGVAIPDDTLAAWAARGVTVPDGRYWYDKLSGIWGLWGGPGQGVVAAGLDLGGPMPSDCSGGGTGVYFNGRELHPTDLATLNRWLGMQVQPGRYWLDAAGNAGYEGGPTLVNLWAAARAAEQASSGGTWSWSGGSAGAIEGSAFVCTGTDCVSWSP